MEGFSEIADSLVVGQDWEGDERIILFVKLGKEISFSNKLAESISDAIRKNCSPRHVPTKILETKDIPYTISGKKVEIAVRKIISGEDVTNRDALANPESLDFYKNLTALQS